MGSIKARKRWTITRSTRREIVGKIIGDNRDVEEVITAFRSTLKDDLINLVSKGRPTTWADEFRQEKSSQV